MLLEINRKTSILYFLKLIRVDIVIITLFTMVIGFIAQGKLLSHLVIPMALVAIIGTALSLLLAFRTGQAYDRWWEARSVWGAIVNDSRSFIRQLQLFLPSECHSDIKYFAERQIVWCYALSESLRKLPFSSKVQMYIDMNKVNQSNVPNEIIAQHASHIKKIVDSGLLSEFREVQLDATLVRLCESMGKCERIKNTIFPMSYAKLIHFSIYLFALMLPFSLDNEFLLIKVIITAIIPLVFFVIEKTAILMQNPFENEPMDTPMTSISQTIELNLLQMVNERVEFPKGPDEKYYFVL